MPYELNLEKTPSEIKKAASQLKLGHSGASDLFINACLYYGNDVWLNTLYVMLNNIFKVGYFPELWSEGFVVPLHKKGSLNDANNCTGITLLLNCVCKLFTCILNNRLYEKLKNLLSFIKNCRAYKVETWCTHGWLVDE